MKRILCLVLALITLLLTSCAVKPIKSSSDDLCVVGTVGSHEIAYEELRFVVNTYKKSLTDSLGSNIFDNGESADAYRKEISEYFAENITFNYTILAMCESSFLDTSNARVDEAVQKEVEKLVESLGGIGKYKKYLRENYLTDKVYRDNVKAEILQNELFYVYVDDFGFIESDTDKIYDIIKKDFVRTQHVYVSKNIDGALDKINTAYSEIEDGADFFETVKKYGEDSSLTEVGEYITRGYMRDEYEAAAYSLDIGEHSGIIESGNGYFIVKRLELDALYIMLNLDMLSERYQRYAFLAMIYEEQKKLEFVPNDYMKGLDLLDLK